MITADIAMPNLEIAREVKRLADQLKERAPLVDWSVSYELPKGFEVRGSVIINGQSFNVLFYLSSSRVFDDRRFDMAITEAVRNLARLIIEYRPK